MSRIWVAATDGSATGAGTKSDPRTLESLIAADSPLTAGDTVLMRAGTYSPLTAGGVGGTTGVNGTATAGKGVYTFLVDGSSGNQITFRNYPGEAVRINGAVHVVSGAGSYITFRGLEIAPTPTTRSFATSAAVDYPSIYITGTGCKILDCYLHDFESVYPMGTGGFEFHGNLIGWMGYYSSDVGINRDYDIYTHNDGGGIILIENNCFMPAFGAYAVHGYSAGNDVRDYYIQDNVVFEATVMVYSFAGDMRNNHINRNYINAKQSTGTSAPLSCIRAEGDDTNANTIEAEITYNYIRSTGALGLLVRDIKTLDLHHNTIVRPNGLGVWAQYETHANVISEVWDYNEYRDGATVANNSRFYNFNLAENEYWDQAPLWRTITGFDANSTQAESNPTANYTAVIKSDYSQRGFVAIYNWEGLSSVTVDISSLALTDGARCRYYNCSNPAEYVDFTYDAGDPTLTISMLAASWTMRDPTAYDSPVTWYAESFPDFGAFLVEEVSRGMTIEEGIYDFLTNDAEVYALVEARIYPMTVPQEIEMPVVAYQVISQTEIMDHDGESNIRTVRVQFTCQAASYEAAKELAREIAVAMRGHKGLMGDVTVESCEVLNEFDGWGAVGGVHTTRVDMGVMYRA